MAARTVRFSNTYFQNVLSEWHSLDNDIKESEAISEFKRKLLAGADPGINLTIALIDKADLREE